MPMPYKDVRQTKWRNKASQHKTTKQTALFTKKNYFQIDRKVYYEKNQFSTRRSSSFVNLPHPCVGHFERICAYRCGNSRNLLKKRLYYL